MILTLYLEQVNTQININQTFMFNYIKLMTDVENYNALPTTQLNVVSGLLEIKVS